MKFTAQNIKFALAIDDPFALEKCKVNKSDRQYQVWKRQPLSVELSTEKVFMQKLDYIHYNPVRAGFCKYPEDYEFSSAMYYENGLYKFGMLTHYLG